MDSIAKILKVAFMAAADRFNLTDPNCAAREIQKVMRQVGEARKNFHKRSGASSKEFYGRLDEELMRLRWPVEFKDKHTTTEIVLNKDIASIIWELSISMDKSSGTFGIRDVLDERLEGGRRQTKDKMEFVIAHLQELLTATQSVMDELDRELKQPGGILLRHTEDGGLHRSVFDKKNEP